MLPAETVGEDRHAVIADTLTRPLLFQIGRTGPQPLPTVPFTPAGACRHRPAKRPVSPTASRVQLFEVGLARVSSGTQWGVFLIPLLLIGCVFFSGRVLARLLCRYWPRRQLGDALWRGSWLGPATVFTARRLLALWAQLLSLGWGSAAPWLTENGLGEPISVVEGITVWPTVALRAFGVLLALVYDLVHGARTGDKSAGNAQKVQRTAFVRVSRSLEDRLRPRRIQ